MVIAARIQLLPAVIDVTHVFAFSGAGGVLTTFIAAALRLPPDRLARLTVLGNPADATGRAERVRPTLSVVSRAVPAVLSIAGSDSGGGAGIQADLKAFARCGVHGMTAITALTAQNTVGVTGVHPVPGAFVVEQVRAVAGDIGVDAVKIGMLGTAEIVAAVDEALDLLEPGTPVVIDPVMVSESGAELLDAAARAALIDTLLPRATVITPNLPEARALAGEAAPDDVADLARALHALGPDVVVITGGHREEATDVLFDGDGIHLIGGARHPDGAAHGSGCTHSSALAAHLALGSSPLQAARAAHAIAADAVRDGLREIGHGPGPVDVIGLTARCPQGSREARTSGV